MSNEQNETLCAQENVTNHLFKSMLVCYTCMGI